MYFCTIANARNLVEKEQTSKNYFVSVLKISYMKDVIDQKDQEKVHKNTERPDAVLSSH